MTTTVTDERRTMMAKIADVHDGWAPQHLDAPFEPDGRPENSDYNLHYADLDSDGEAQDDYASKVAAAIGADQTASWMETDHPRGHGGKFTKGSAVGKAIGSGEPDSLAGFSREQLQREVRRRNRDGAGIKLKRGASVDEIKDALHRHERGSDSGGGGEAPTDGDKAQAQANIENLMEVTKAREKLKRAEQMHGSDRSKWTKQDQDAAAKLDKVIAGSGPRPGSMAERRAARDKADQERDMAKRRQEGAFRRLAEMPASEQGEKLNDLTRRINDPDISAANRMELEEQRRELRRLMGVKVTTTKPVRARTPDLKETTKYSNPAGNRQQSEAAPELFPGANKPWEHPNGPVAGAIDMVKTIQQRILGAPPDERGAEEGAEHRAREALKPLTKAQLLEAAVELNVPVFKSASKAKLIADIVAVKIGWPITSRSIERPTLGGNQTAALDDGNALDEVFSAALEAAMALDDDASEEEFAAAFMGEFQSRMPEHLAEYWTEGPGMARVRWFVRGAFRRCRRVLRSEGVPGRMLDGTCANLYHRATGRWPGRHGNQKASADLDEFAALDVDELEDLIDILMQEMNMDLGTQTACGCGGEVPMMPYEAAADAEVDAFAGLPAEDEVWRWEGPLAPIASPTGDHVKRRFAAGALSSRALPLPLRWQERQESGHDGAVVVGALTGYRMSQDGTPVGGEAYFFDETIIPEAGKARYLTEHGVIAPSLDLEPSMDVAYTDEKGNTFNPSTCAVDGSCPTRPEVMITRGTVAGATLVPIAAFGELGSGRMFRGPQPRPMAYSAGTQIAAVQASGWDDMPIADREHEWDKSAADARVTAWATDDGEIDWSRYGQAFLWHSDSPATKGAFKFPVADIVEGDLTIIPRAVYNAAARLNQADIPGPDKEAMREVLSDLYDQIADEFDDDIMAPWDDDREELSVQDCGCASKMAAGTQTASAGCASCGAKYGVFGDLDPYPADAFGPVRFDQITPLHIEQRPGEKFARLVGHVGDWKGCHRSFKHVCLPPPRSRTNYSEFHTAGYARTTDGMVRVGKVVMGEGHPDASVPARIARAYYDATSKEVGHVRGYEDQFGPYVNGVVAPGVTPQEATKLLASPPSGDWKDHEMIAVLAVNVGGHPVRSEATLDANGLPRNMVAAGRWWPWDDDADTDLLTGAEAALWEAEFALLDKVIG